MIDAILAPWPWYVSGALIALSMFFMFYFGKRLGISSNLESMCTIGGAGRVHDFFKIDLKKKSWNLLFALGLIIGGFIAANYLMANQEIALNPKTIHDLQELGFDKAGASYLPPELFDSSQLTVKPFLILLVAGFLVGFGARYAGGCTSGHAIVGISNLELPSVVAVIGFFIGGLIMTWFIYPLLF